MRIIAGKYRGRRLKSPPSVATRPTSDRLRETLFNILAPRIEGVRFLDLCAGSGAVGIEALSRGAAHVTFVENSKGMCALIEANLNLCRIENKDRRVVLADAAEFLRRARKLDQEPWDIVFFDPPYADEYEGVLELFGASAASLLSEDGLLVVEHGHKNELKEEYGSLSRTRIVKQSDSALDFYSCQNRER
jgi:16S rRNA (guanine(966)-N(2))-methyltransferase RsmD